MLNGSIKTLQPIGWHVRLVSMTLKLSKAMLAVSRSADLVRRRLLRSVCCWCIHAICGRGACSRASVPRLLCCHAPRLSTAIGHSCR
jgi:hypothetical protein